ncbi:PREDICTED: NCK-interacting protein with SH3 domain-like [Amphimedon queenslandica]|uniref:SH3 domain-containing protein n=1 Tax=Amphimedon queenslandica TaxID=400682 RepID=A0A1X7VD25_AMPQE|nr:PREDICTED: NCK-interacting protein with SH3 domain-like [Amphimedon queenslandica]|eukprot:XP_003384974.1 PREDICTED: NCK-interacting protein with SH3 domain-like [Amphimedon queenslandica]
MATHKVLYDFAGEEKKMLKVKAGELVTVTSSGNNWSTVQKGSTSGLVPASYLEAILPEEKSTHSKGSVFIAMFDYVGQAAYQIDIKKNDKLILRQVHTKDWYTMKNMSTGREGMVPASYVKQEETTNNNGVEPQSAEAIKDVLLSIDRAIDKIHVDATTAGGFYTAEQRSTLQTLVAHRQSVVNSSESKERTKSPNTMEASVSTFSSPSPIPMETTSSPVPREMSSSPSPSHKNKHRRKAPPPPQPTVEPLDLAGVQLREKEGGAGANRPQSELIINVSRPAPPPPTRTVSLSKHTPSPSHIVKESEKKEEEGKKEGGVMVIDMAAQKEELRDSREQSVECDDNSSQSSDGATLPVGGISPKTKQRLTSYLNRVGQPGNQLETLSESEGFGKKLNLPTEFSNDTALELIDVIRNRTGLSHPKSALALEGVLGFLEEKVPEIAPVMDGLLASLRASQAKEEDNSLSEDNEDLKRLKHIFFEMREARDDSQQRGWAVRDDSEIISQYLEELLQILYDADPIVSKAAIQEDKYENILVLISYYQLEPRVQLRILLLKVFGACCTLDQEVVSVMLQSVLPNELGHDIQINTNETQKVLFSSIVCTMMFSTAEDVPLPVYDQWSAEFVKFLLDNIEDPPESDVNDELPDAFLNMILSFNQHFEYPSTNIVMQVLKVFDNPRSFSEKLMLLVNRGEDPVSIVKPCCPDSLTKILLDLFSDPLTSGVFYTTDLKVLIDIISRQLHDLAPGDKSRSHYIELLQRLITNTQYTDHHHRRSDLTSCLKRILREEGEESIPDQGAIKKLLETFPGLFDGSS